MAPIEVSDYVLGELSGEELAEAERLLREDPEFRAQVERLTPIVGELNELPPEAWRGEDPPPLPREPAAPRRKARPGWFGFRPALATGAAALLLAIGIGIGVLLAESDEEPAGSTIALQPVEQATAGSGSATFVGSDEPDEVAVEVAGLDASAEGEHYEIWLLSSPDDLVSLGSFRVPESGEAAFRVPLPVAPETFQFVDISVEQNDGDSSHSGQSVLRAST